MHGVTSVDPIDNVKLGPVLTSTVEVEGEPVEALLDTGSPMTIISWEWLLQLLAKKRLEGQSPSEWKAEVEKWLEPTTVVLKNYSGDRLRVVRQIRIHLARSGFTMKAVIQVQKGAPASLLVGTDVLPQLGYLFVQSTMEGEDTDLLGSGHGFQPNQGIKNISDAQVNKEHCDRPKENCNGSEVAGTVQLIQATKLPARHTKMVRTQIFNVTYGGCNCVNPTLMN